MPHVSNHLDFLHQNNTIYDTYYEWNAIHTSMCATGTPLCTSEYFFPYSYGMIRIILKYFHYHQIFLRSLFTLLSEEFLFIAIHLSTTSYNCFLNILLRLVA